MRRSFRTRVRRLLVAPVVCGLVLPAVASATGIPGLHIDPPSPVAKAYALPLEGARAIASTGGNAAKLFGSGITRAQLGRHVPARQLQGHAAPAAYRVLEAGSGSGLAWMAIAAVVVLACGGAGALALRRRR